MIQTDKKIKRSDIDIFSLPFRKVVQEEFYGVCDKVQQSSFYDGSWNSLKGRNQKKEGYHYAIW